MSLVPLTYLRTSHAGHAIARYLYYLPEFFPHYSGGGAQGTRPPPFLFLHQTEAQIAEKCWGGDRPPPPQGMNLALH